MSLTAAPRPGTVTLLAVLTVLNALLDLAAGVVLILMRHNATIQQSISAGPDFILWVGVAEVVAGIITLAVARGLMTGNGFARFVVAVLSLINVVYGGYSAVTHSGNVRLHGIVIAVIGLLILLILYSRRSNEFFRSN